MFYILYIFLYIFLYEHVIGTLDVVYVATYLVVLNSYTLEITRVKDGMRIAQCPGSAILHALHVELPRSICAMSHAGSLG